MSEASASRPKQCVGQRRDGLPCTAPALLSAYCWAHDPEREQERAEGRRKGGRNRADVVRLRGLVPPRLMAVYERLEQALAQVHEGALEPKQAQAMAAL